MTRLRVAVTAQLRAGGSSGGIEQFVAALVHALGSLNDGDEEYAVIGPAVDSDWLSPYLGPNSTLVPLRPPGRLRSVVSRFGAAPTDFYASLGVDVVHFTWANVFKPTCVPTVYNPHDLQHRHLPQFFSEWELAYRDDVYGRGCRQATVVATESDWVKHDVVRQFDVEPARVAVVHRGAPFAVHEPPDAATIAGVRARYELPARFGLFPAQTWPHKNHLGLAAALRALRARGASPPAVVCPGFQNDYFPTIMEGVRELEVTDLLHFVGFVEPVELRALYAAADFVVFPSLFEGGGFPVVEAFAEGKPVACSNVTSLPQYAGDAALLFDPRTPEAIADAIARLTGDSGLAEQLARRGRERLSRFSWATAAATYRALYRRLARRETDEHDAALIGATGYTAG